MCSSVLNEKWIRRVWKILLFLYNLEVCQTEYNRMSPNRHILYSFLWKKNCLKGVTAFVNGTEDLTKWYTAVKGSEGHCWRHGSHLELCSRWRLGPGRQHSSAAACYTTNCAGNAVHKHPSSQQHWFIMLRGNIKKT